MPVMRTADVPRATSLATFKPNAKQRRLIEDSGALLSMIAPFWASILYGEMDIRYTTDVPYAATDGHTIFVNPDAWAAEGWTIHEGCFVLGHEVMHYVLAHLIMGVGWRKSGVVPTAAGPLAYVHDLMNRAMDYTINAALIKARVGKMPKIALYDATLSLEGMEDCVEVYVKLQRPGSEPISRKPGFDEHLEPSDEDQKAEKANGAERRAHAIAKAAQAHQAAGAGDLPASIKRLVNEVLNPTVPWGEHLRATMVRSAGVPALDWRKVNRRMITRPDRVVYAKQGRYGCGPVVVGWDTSGSTEKWQDAFFAEIGGIIEELNPTEIWVLRCDTKVHNADRLEEASDLEGFRTLVNEDGIGGGGGTKFEPVFDWIEDNQIQPDMVVYLTDCWGSFPQEPNYPVIWADIDGRRKPPFGQVVRVKV